MCVCVHMHTHTHTQVFLVSGVASLVSSLLWWQFTQKPPGVSVLITNFVLFGTEKPGL